MGEKKSGPRERSPTYFDGTVPKKVGQPSKSRMSGKPIYYNSTLSLCDSTCYLSSSDKWYGEQIRAITALSQTSKGEAPEKDNEVLRHLIH
jgi:hypothetical protein